MLHKVRLSDEAKSHLRSIRRHIAKESSKRIALNYVRQISAVCAGLNMLPDRGNRHEELLPGLRIIGFDRRVTIAFRVSETTVDVLAILYGGRDLETYFRSQSVH